MTDLAGVKEAKAGWSEREGRTRAHVSITIPGVSTPAFSVTHARRLVPKFTVIEKQVFFFFFLVSLLEK